MSNNFYLNTKSEPSWSEIIGAIIALIIVFIFEPFIVFWCSYFGGWLAKLMVGSHLVEGLKLIHISVELNQIPLLAGVLGWIGTFFRNMWNINKNK